MYDIPFSPVGRWRGMFGLAEGIVIVGMGTRGVGRVNGGGLFSDFWWG